MEAADALPTAGEEAAETKDPPLQQAASYHNQQEEIYLPAKQLHRHRHSQHT